MSRCDQLPSTDVIARRAKPDVAISWYRVRIRTLFQEIPTGFALGMTRSLGWIQSSSARYSSAKWAALAPSAAAVMIWRRALVRTSPTA